MSTCYWMIDYSIRFLSDFHVGAGITLLGGNLHGLRRDKTGFPYLPHTQVRGLLRLGGLKLRDWQHQNLENLDDVFNRNFGQADRNGNGLWTYTSARYPEEGIVEYSGSKVSGTRTEQSHIKLAEGGVENLFSYEKAGRIEAKPAEGAESKWLQWRGRIYSVEPAEEKDVAFLIACMRAEDRIGRRRTRGYGKVDWKLEKVRWYIPSESKPKKIKEPHDWLKLVIT